jgi:epoxide hydrolase-like predicted phosphatase
MIRGIIFDCFGVLYQGSVAHLHELAPDAQRAELLNLSLSSDYGYVSHEEFVVQAADLLGKTTADIEMIMKSDHVRNTVMIDIIRELKPKYKIGLLSNVGRGVMDRLFSADELQQLFDVVVLSSEVGMVKPDPAIYQLTATKLGVAPEECLMVDDLAVNIDGAVSINMQGVVFTTTSTFTHNLAEILHA